MPAAQVNKAAHRVKIRGDITYRRDDGEDSVYFGIGVTDDPVSHKTVFLIAW